MTAIGPGAGDDKGGMAVMVAALRAMQAAGTLKNADIEIVLTGDEEDSGNPIELARRDLIAAGKRADVALDFEGLAQEDGKDMGSIARRSSGSWTLTVTGQARPFERHLLAPARAMARSMSWRGSSTRFRRELPEDKLTFNVGLIGGGATAELDDGPHPAGGDRQDQHHRRHRGRARRPSRADPGADRPGPGEDAGDRRPAAARRDGEDRLRRRRLSADGADRRATARCSAGSTRSTATWAWREWASSTRSSAAPATSASSPRTSTGWSASARPATATMRPGETVDIASIWRQAKRAAILMSRLSREKR